MYIREFLFVSFLLTMVDNNIYPHTSRSSVLIRYADYIKWARLEGVSALSLFLEAVKGERREKSGEHPGDWSNKAKII